MNAAVRFAAACGVAVCLFAAPRARGDGLVYKLPADGTSVTYDMEMEQSTDRKMSGTFTVSSVGAGEVDGEKARWIEFAMTMNEGGEERTIFGKALVPEKEFKQGGKPFENAGKIWVKMGPGGVEQVEKSDSQKLGPLPAFLAGPLEGQMTLPAEEVESGLGKLECKGVAGTLALKDGPGDVNLTIENRLHDKAPFGVVKSIMKFKVKRDDEVREQGTLTLVLKEIGMNAESGLPDAK